MSTLVIANKNYSSWSLRAWLALRHAGIDFTETRITLGRPQSKAEILKWSPSGKVPAFKEGGLVIWESLAICEYAAERAADNGHALWPAEPRARAIARSVSAEMHAGFTALRTAMSMNLRATGRRVELTPAIVADIDRIERIWVECRGRFADGPNAGPWLFGQWSMADAMFAPVATRFVTYGVHRPGVFDDYIAAVIADPAYQEWRSAALAETEVLPDFEMGDLNAPAPAPVAAKKAVRKPRVVKAAE